MIELDRSATISEGGLLMAVVRMNFLSKMLGMQTNVTIVLPTFSFGDIMSGRKAYYEKGMQYQVLWLLHGGSGDDSDYLHFSSIVRYADEHKLAVVMPAGFNQSYTDDPEGAKYFRYVVDELPEMLQALYPFSDKREDNFVGGLSMGAHGAMKAAIMRPEKFGAALVMSGAARNPDQPMKPLAAGDSGIAMPSAKDLNIKGTENDAYYHAEKNVAEGRPLPEFFITCGDKDFSLERSQYAADFLKKLGYPVHTDWVPGYAHEWDFWDLSLRKAIKEWLPIRHGVIYPEE